MSCHIKTFKTPPSRLYMILSCKNIQLHYFSSLDSCNTVTRMSHYIPSFHSRSLHYIVPMARIDCFSLSPRGGSFSSFRSRLRYLLFREIFSDPKWSLITLYHPGVSFIVVLHTRLIRSRVYCLPLPELQESRGLLPGLITTKLPVTHKAWHTVGAWIYFIQIMNEPDASKIMTRADEQR